MNKLPAFLAVAFAALLQGGCQMPPQAPPQPPAALPSSGVARSVDPECAGGVANPRPDALQKVDSPLVASAQGPRGKGGLCAADAFSANGTVRIYRVWDVTRPNSAFGRWWSLGKPDESKASYRRSFGICRDYSALDRLISCNVKLSATVVIGTTQSVECPDKTALPRTDALQVYVDNDLYRGKLFVDDCRDEDIW